MARWMEQLAVQMARDPEALRAEGWTRRALAGGERLWAQGELADSLVWVVKGRLCLLRDGREIATLGAGALAGEASVFIEGERRSGTLQATEPTVVERIMRGRLAELRRGEDTVYDALLAAALEAMVGRVKEVDGEVAERSPCGGPVEAPRGLAPSKETPTAEEVLSQLPVLGEACPKVRACIASELRPHHLDMGEALCRQGEVAEALYVVVSGEISVIHRREGKVLRFPSFGPGQLVGFDALLGRSTRSVDLIAEAGPVELFELRTQRAEAMPCDALRVLRECLLVLMRAQLIHSNERLIALLGSRGSLPFEDALGVMGALEGWQAGGPMMEVALSTLPAVDPVAPPDPDKARLFARIREGIIGGDVALEGPFGLKRVVYADYTASGRSLRFFEDFLRDQVMPLYANTHTEASASGLQTTRLREEARAAVARSVGAGPEDVVIFTGSGATGAVNKLVDALNIRLPADLDIRYKLSDHVPLNERPVVFIGPYEHHSNILPWRHSLADVHIVPLDREGGLDMEALEELLIEHSERPLRIGSFSAASNVTGITTDVDGVTALLHRHGALSFWDYAAAGPYVRIDMNAPGAPKDAVFLSPHKFVGGPGTPGLLIAKRALLHNTVPTQPGGGTVDAVTADHTLYSDSLEHREEAGTPAILESIRCGLVFQLKDLVGAETIHRMEQAFVRRAIDTWLPNPAIRILGNPDADRLSITSFMVRHGPGFLHHNFVVALLNDLFGVQARGGCSCAGPYGVTLLGLGPASGAMFVQRSEEGWLSLKPGWARVNFNYFISEAEFRYVVSAVNLVAIYGWALMPRYRVDPCSGLWTHRVGSDFVPVSLSAMVEGLRTGEPLTRRHKTLPESALDEQLEAGRRVLMGALSDRPEAVVAPELPEEFEAARWFPLPHEVAAYLRDHGEAAGDTPSSVRLEAYGSALRRGNAGVIDTLRRALRISPEEHWVAMRMG